MGKYVGIVHRGTAMFFNPSPGKIIEGYVCAAVAFRQRGKADRIVQEGRSYRDGELSAKEVKGLQARADKMAVKWQRYFERTGKRFELEQDAKRKAKEEQAKAERMARQAVMEAGPALRVALHSLVHAIRFDTGLVDDAMRRADELLAELPR